MKIDNNKTILKNNYFAHLSNITLEKAIQRTFTLHKGEEVSIGGDSEELLCLVKGKIKVANTVIDTNDAQPLPFPNLPETLTIHAIDDAVVCQVNGEELNANAVKTELELITFAACPYGQRTLITLLYTNSPHKLTVIEPGNLPTWFKQVSPLGKVPILRVGDEKAIFESSVINDYLNQVTDNYLLPNDSLHRALCCSWIEFCSTCLSDFMNIIVAPSKTAFNEANDNFLKNLQILEQQVDENGPYFVGEQFTLVDSTYAPLFLRMEHLSEIVDFYTATEFPRIKNWSKNLLAQEAVQKSVIGGDFSKIFRMFVQKMGKDGYVNSLCK
ncbi:glutathione S-transferase family protein [Candidatus Halobeggiatoa sp. HSG11]|nr:glutathione S-transferase family protein [Candidatus Halobeggiatoa sp. HSG11]